MTPALEKPNLKIWLANPRGFCAGVDRAIQIVERAIALYGAPVYVRHEIVHNKHVVERLKALGAVFVKELDQCPQDRPVVFSAHGVPKSVPQAAKDRKMFYLDATCPLVSKVHVEAERHFNEGREIILIGHAGHPEVIGTMGQLPADAVKLVETVEDAQNFEATNPENLAYVTQTTLSVDDTSAIIDVLRLRFPKLAAPRKEDICYATTNRQEAVKTMAEKCDLFLIIGSKASSNSQRLVEVAHRGGCEAAYLIDDADGVEWTWFEGVSSIGISAGASAPESLIKGLISALNERFTIEITDVSGTIETTTFKLPKALQGENSAGFLA